HTRHVLGLGRGQRLLAARKQRRRTSMLLLRRGQRLVAARKLRGRLHALLLGSGDVRLVLRPCCRENLFLLSERGLPLREAALAPRELLLPLLQLATRCAEPLPRLREPLPAHRQGAFLRAAVGLQLRARLGEEVLPLGERDRLRLERRRDARELAFPDAQVGDAVRGGRTLREPPLTLLQRRRPLGERALELRETDPLLRHCPRGRGLRSLAGEDGSQAREPLLPAGLAAELPRERLELPLPIARAARGLPQLLLHPLDLGRRVAADSLPLLGKPRLETLQALPFELEFLYGRLRRPLLLHPPIIGRNLRKAISAVGFPGEPGATPRRAGARREGPRRRSGRAKPRSRSPAARSNRAFLLPNVARRPDEVDPRPGKPLPRPGDVARDADRHRGDGRRVMDDVEPDSGERLRRPALPQEQCVEAAVQRDERDRRGSRTARPPARDPEQTREGRGRARAVPPAQVER